MSGFSIDPRQFQPSFAGGGGCNIPIGETMAFAVSHEVKGSRNGNGGYLAIMMQDQVTGRQGIWRFNLWNQSSEAVRIAHEQFSGLLAAAGWNMQVPFEETNMQWLYNKPVPILVGEQVNDPQRRAEIKGALNRQPNMQNNQTSGMQAPQGFQPPQGGAPNAGVQAPNPSQFGQQGGVPAGNGWPQQPPQEQQPPQQQNPGSHWPQQPTTNPGGQQGFQPPQGGNSGPGGFQPPQGGAPNAGGFQPPQGPQNGGAPQWTPQNGNPNGGGRPNW